MKSFYPGVRRHAQIENHERVLQKMFGPVDILPEEPDHHPLR